MNREKRQFVHEYCEHFGCESVAYDAEPKRNVVATAQRDKVCHNTSQHQSFLFGSIYSLYSNYILLISRIYKYFVA